jgi:adenylyl- and sulfurtransferase ThiI
MTSTESVLKSLPVFRPVIGFDKQEIIEIAQKIGTLKHQFSLLKIVVLFSYQNLQ